MKSKDLQPLKMSLHGMDERMQKMMANYFKLPCRGTAIVVDDSEAHAEIVDVDLAPSKSLLEERLAQKPSKPIIALSLNEISASGVIYVKKPIAVPDVLAAFGLTRKVLLGKASLEKPNKPTPPAPETASPDTTEKPKPPIQPKTSKQKQPNQKKPKTSEQQKQRPKSTAQTQTPIEPKEVSDVISQALQKANATSYLTPQQKALNEKVASDYDTKQRAEKRQPSEKSEQPKQQEPANKEQILPKKSTKKSEVKPSPEQQPAPPKQPAVDQTIATEKAKIAEPDKDLQFEKERLTKPALAEKLSTTQPSRSFLDTLLQRKGLIAGLTCLFTLLAGIYIFQLTPIYEARARIFISESNATNIPGDPSSVEDILDLTVAQQKIDEIVTRQLAGQTIKTLKLDTIPEFIAAAENLNNQASASALRQERQTAEQFSSMTDYFLQNLKASQFRNSPIINIDFQSEDPKLAAKVATQLAKGYVDMQRDKKIEMENQLADWESNKLPAAKNKVKQSQDALELYIEMNKWSQFEQQFAEDMGVNSEIRALEKKLKADLSLYEIFLTRFENLKKDANVVEVKLISSAEVPVDPSSPNKLKFLFIALLSAFLIALVIAYILSVLKKYGEEKASA
jgi:uncharacterized protein involved in exopolysaccharide biosynthesis